MAEDICKIMLKDVRLSFPQLFRAKAFGDGSQGEPAFSAEFLIDKNTKLGQKTLDMIDDAIYEAKVKKWGEDEKKWPKISKDKPFFKDGDDPDYERPETEGMMIVSSRNPKKPRILGIDKEDLHESDGIIYGGCYVDAIVRVWAQDNKFGKRVNCSLEAVRFRRDGDAFGAAPIDPDEFEDIEGGEDDRRSSRSRGSRDRDDDRGSSRGSSRGGRDRDEDRDDDRGSSRRSSRSSRDDDDRDEDKGSSRRGRDRDDEGDDRGSSRGRSRDRDDDGDDRGSSRRSSRDDDDDRSSSRRGRDDERGGSRRGRDEDEDDDRGRGGSRSSRGGRDDDEGDDRPSRNSRSRGRRDDDDNGI